MSNPNQKKNLRIRILRQTTANAAPARVDDVIDVPANDAHFLVGLGRAEHAPDAKLVQNPPAHQARAKGGKKDEGAAA